jgi:EthD domain
MTHKVFIFLKRRPGMSVEEFRDHYENRHRPLMDKYMAGLTRYTRNYLNPMPHLDTKEITEPEFDCITELHFESKAAFDGLNWMVSKGQLPPEILEDELRVFDRPKTRYCWITECNG